MWCPPRDDSLPNRDLIATTGDYLRLWELNTTNNHVTMRALLNNQRSNGIYKYFIVFTCLYINYYY